MYYDLEFWRILICLAFIMPQSYTPQDYANMHLIYGECRCNANAASRLYRERYPKDQRYPDYRVFINVHQEFSESRMPSSRRNVGRLRLDRDEEVINEIKNDSTTLARAIKKATAIPKSSRNATGFTHITTGACRRYYRGTIHCESHFAV